MESAHSSEMYVRTCPTTQYCIPEDSDLQQEALFNNTKALNLWCPEEEVEKHEWHALHPTR
jgi:hypothetical protein